MVSVRNLCAMIVMSSSVFFSFCEKPAVQLSVFFRTAVAVVSISADLRIDGFCEKSVCNDYILFQ